MAQRAEITFLHRILGIGRPAHEVAGKCIDVVEIRHRERLEAGRLTALIGHWTVLCRPATASPNGEANSHLRPR